jgi:hypothetical protein
LKEVASHILDPSEVCQILVTKFSLEELKTFCFDLKIDYETLGNEKPQLASNYKIPKIQLFMTT